MSLKIIQGGKKHMYNKQLCKTCLSTEENLIRDGQTTKKTH